MGKISIQELANVLIERKKMNRRDASLFVSAMFDIVQQRLETDKLVKVKGLGTFKIIDVEDRESVNVNTGERVLIEGHGKITFAPDALLKELVNKPFAQFETVVLNDGVDFDDVDTTTTDAPEPEIESEPIVEPEPIVETEAIVEPAIDEDHSSLPLVDFGGDDEPAVEPEEEPEEEPVEDLEDEPEDELEEEFDDDIETTVRPEATTIRPEVTTIRPEATTVRPEMPEAALEVESELDEELEPEMEAMMAGTEPKIIEDISDEDIPEWVIEPYVAQQPEQPVVEPEPEPVVESPKPAATSNLQSILSSFQTIKKPAPAPEPEPEPEPIVAPEPEPIVAPEPEPMAIPEPEPVIIPEPEPVVIPEPEPVVEEHKMTADEELAAAFKNASDSETIVSEPVVPESEPELEEPEDDDTEADEPEFETARTRKSGGKWLLALLACIVGLGGGYLLGNYYPYANFLPVEGNETVIHVQKEVAPEPQVTDADTKEAEVKAAEEAKAAEAQAEAEAKAKAEADAKAKAAADAKVKADAEADAKAKAATDKYDAMDVRVRLGAYRIVGTDKTVKVKESEDLVKISRRYLGPDMECYLEVFNNVKASTPLKVGQEIKIPKLELKKKKKTATAN